MTRAFILAAMLLWTSLAVGQTVPGRFPPGTVYGNRGATEAPPATIPTIEIDSGGFTTLQAAITAAAGKTLRVRAGSYVQTATLIIKSNTRMVCDPGATITLGATFTFVDSYQDLIRNENFTASTITDHDISIEGCTFTSIYPTIAGGINYIQFRKAQRIWIKNNTFIGQIGDSTAMMATDQTVMANNYTVDALNACHDHWEGVKNVVVENNVCNSLTANSIMITGSDSLGVAVLQSGPGTVSGNVINIKDLTYSVSAASWAATSGGQATFTTSTPFTLSAFPGSSIRITGVSPSGYNGTYTTLTGTTGSTVIVALASNPGAYVSGGTIVANRTGVGVMLNGLGLAGNGSSGITVTGNTILGSGTVSAVCVQNTGLSQGNVISGNICRGFGTNSAGVASGSDGGGTPSNTIIANNVFENIDVGAAYVAPIQMGGTGEAAFGNRISGGISTFGFYVVGSNQTIENNFVDPSGFNIDMNAAAGGATNFHTSGQVWPTTWRPAHPATGASGYNTTLNSQEYWNGTAWVAPAPAGGTATWTTAGRPASPSAGTTGFNTTLNIVETWNGTAWVGVASNGAILYGENFGIKADGTTIDTTAFNAALSACSAGGKTLMLPAGIILLDNTYTLNNCNIVGKGLGQTTLLRSTANTQTALIQVSGANVTVEGLTIDCNKAGNANPVNCVLWNAYYNVHFRNMRVTGGKTVSGGYGDGIVIVGPSTDGAQNTRSSLENVSADHNDFFGVEVRSANGFDFMGGYYCYNAAGASLGENFPPGTITVSNVTMTGGQYCNNTGSGIGVSGFSTAVTSLGVVYGSNPQAEFVTITGAEVYGNAGYGIAFSGRRGIVSGNSIHDNSPGGGTAGGVLFNADRSTLEGNIITANGNYGVDAGGCLRCKVSNNYISETGIGMGTAGSIAINVGASTNAVVSGNVIHLSSQANAHGIFASLYDSGGGAAPALPNPTSGLSVTNNKVYLGATPQSAIGIPGAPATVFDNEVFMSPSAPTAFADTYSLTNQTLASNNNKILQTNGQIFQTLASATSMTIPDGGTDFKVTGTTTITAMPTTSMSLAGFVTQAIITNPGSGITTPASVVVTFGAGPCSIVPTAVAVASADGSVRGITMTNYGGACSSPPSCTISGGGITGATCTSQVFFGNIAGRMIRLWLSGGGTINSGNNIKLASGSNFTATNSQDSDIAW